MRRIIVLAVLFVAACWAQPSQVVIIPGSPPGGAGAACTDTAHGYLASTGIIYTCQSGTWQAQGGSSGTCGSPNCTVGGNLTVSGTATIGARVPGTGNGVYANPTTGLDTNKINTVAVPAMQIRACEIVVGDPGSGSSVLQNDNDTPAICGNVTGAAMTITAVECYADAGAPTVTPIITGGGGTSILSGALTCGAGSFAAGTLNGAPSQTNGQTIDGNITVAGGAAKYLVIRITRTL